MGNVWPAWLADAARLTGYPVVEVAGWRTRGHGGFRALEGMGLHHTADGPGEYPSLRVVRDGRSDLAGPLCNYGLGRSGTIYVVAAGVAWHAGASTWSGFADLNDEFLGVEAESKGSIDDWTPEQRDAYPRLAAAAMYYLRRGSDRVAGHKEICLPRGRKIDPAYWDLNAFRAQVAWYLADPLRRIPRFTNAVPPAPAAAAVQPPHQKESVMYIKCELNGPGKGISTAMLVGPIFCGLAGGEAKSADGNIDKGALVQWIDPATWRELDKRSHALCDNPRPAAIDFGALTAAVTKAITDASATPVQTGGAA